MSRPKTTEELNQEFDAILGAAAELGQTGYHELRARGHLLVHKEAEKQAWRRQQYVWYTACMACVLVVVFWLLLTFYRPTPVLNRPVRTVYVPRRVQVLTVRWHTPGLLLPRQAPASPVRVTVSDGTLDAVSREAQVAVDWCSFAASPKAVAACAQAAGQADADGSMLLQEHDQQGDLSNDQVRYLQGLGALHTTAQALQVAVAGGGGVPAALGRFQAAAGVLQAQAAGNP